MTETDKKNQKKQPLTVYTVGHSTHPIEEFIDILKAHEIETLADIRTIPKSRHNPQFGGESLAKSLKKAGIGYIYMKDLGGLRQTRKDSPNRGWRNASFRGYADYMQTPAFENALEELIALARRSRVAIMCAEAVPWRCHRSLVGDALLVRDVAVIDIMTAQKSSPHKLTSFAEVEGKHILYPGAEGTMNDLFPPA
jgi:uncharacterized protein (DUF488 family)